MKYVGIAAMLLGLFASAEAAAQDKLRFNIGTVAVEGEIPSGFCLPSGSAIPKAKMGEASDPENVTHATLYACARMADDSISDYFLIKTPKNLIDVATTRTEILDMMTKELTDPGFSAEKLSAEASAAATESTSKASGTRTNVVTDIRPLGRDKNCAYMGGLVSLTTQDQVFTLNVGGCMTAVGGRFLMVFRYAKGNTVAAAAALLPEAHNLAMALRSK